MKEKAIIISLCSILLLLDFILCDKSDYFCMIKSAQETAIIEITEQEFSPVSEDNIETVSKPSLYSMSACMIDTSNKRALFSKSANNIMPMASTTKILTCLIALESCNLNDIVTASAYASSMPDVQLNMTEGEKFYLKDLLYSLMLESHNDSAVAIAEHISGSTSEFAVLMNERANEIGCRLSCFLTPNGLDYKLINEDGSEKIHSTTANELALIMSECIKNKSFVEICQTLSKTITNVDGTIQYSLSNHNTLLKTMKGVIAGKTGFTCNAGYCYVAAVNRGETTVAIALLACGWPNNKNYKWYDMNVLIDFLEDEFNYYDYRAIAKIQEQDISIPVLNGIPTTAFDTDNTIEVKCSVKISTDSGYPKQVLMNKEEVIHVIYEIPKALYAPVKIGDEVGTITYFIDTTMIGSDTLVTDTSIEKISLFYYLRRIYYRFIMNSNH